MLVVCSSLAACDESEDLGELAEAEAEAEAELELGRALDIDVVTEAEAEAELDVAIKAEPYKIVNKVKKPRPEHLIGWTRW
ncbi:MAG TPA: hypothetical protein VK034_20305, partial [Enhygromyxa sp.]|nr:hypothetical protein [Enhygromyxa sp.]